MRLVRNAIVVPFVFTAIVSSVACSGGEPECQSLAIETSLVTVVDQATGAEICDATVVAALAGGGTSAPFTVDGVEATGCHYVAPSTLVDGAYTLAATAPGYALTTAQDYTAVEKGCGNGSTWEPSPPNAEVSLVLAPAGD